MINQVRSIGFAAALAAAVGMGCGKGGGAGPAGSSSAAAATPAGAHKTGATAMVADRKADVKFSKSSGAGAKRQLMFNITNHGGKETKFMQSWIFYYDAKGKYLDRYPHAFGDPIKDGQTLEKGLGFSGDKIPKAATQFEAEITRMEFSDGTLWFNENLETGSERPLGGLTAAQLKEKTGEKLTGVYTGKKRVKGIFAITNTTAKPVKYAYTTVYYYGADGKRLERGGDSINDTIRPGETIEKELGLEAEKIPSGATTIEVTIPQVTFADDTRWENKNLDSSDRPAGG